MTEKSIIKSITHFQIYFSAFTMLQPCFYVYLGLSVLIVCANYKTQSFTFVVKLFYSLHLALCALNYNHHWCLTYSFNHCINESYSIWKWWCEKNQPLVFRLKQILTSIWCPSIYGPWPFKSMTSFELIKLMHI
jgi:hypothetical protein